MAVRRLSLKVPDPPRAVAPCEPEHSRPRHETLRRAAQVGHHPVPNGRVENRPLRIKSPTRRGVAVRRAPPQQRGRRRRKHRHARDGVNCAARHVRGRHVVKQYPLVCPGVCASDDASLRRHRRRQTDRDRRCDDVLPQTVNPPMVATANRSRTIIDLGGHPWAGLLVVREDRDVLLHFQYRRLGSRKAAASA